MNKLQLILANRHTSGAAAVFVLAKLLSMLGAIWMPAHQAQFEATANVIESTAIGYGMLMSGDAKPINGGGAKPAEPPTTT